MSDSKPRAATVSPALGDPAVSRRRPPERQRGARAAGPKAQPESATRSTWFPIIVRVGSIGLTLLGLAGIGLAAGQTELPGIVRMASAALGSSRPDTGGDVWLAPAPAAGAAPAAAGAAPPVAGAATLGALSEADSKPAQPVPCPPAPPPQPEARPVHPGSPQHNAAPKPEAGLKPEAPNDTSHSNSEPESQTREASGGLTSDGKVVLNRAGVAELTRLPSVGAKRAEAILALRQRLGGFRHPSDLLRVRGIGTRTLTRMLPQLVVDPVGSGDPPTGKTER